MDDSSSKLFSSSLELDQYWLIAKRKRSNDYVLLSRSDASHFYHINQIEANILRLCTGSKTFAQIKATLEKKYPSIDVEQKILELLSRLQSLGIVSEQAHLGSEEATTFYHQTILKDSIEVVDNNNSHVLLRNSEDLTFIEIDLKSYEAIALLGNLPASEICSRLQMSEGKLNRLVRTLRLGGMVKGSEKPQPKQGKWTPMKLLYIKKPLFNPDPFLGKPAQWLSFLWTKPAYLFILVCLGFSTLIGFSELPELIGQGSYLFQTQRQLLLLPFALLAMLVVTIHEMGHALTLKHFGGEVREMGLLFMFLMPAAYTNSTDSYRLKSRRQRILVVAAGVLCQCILAMIAFWIWYFAVDNSWLKPAGYLFWLASVFTIVMNLNPLVKFDGYHLAVAMTEINNLRDRSFKFYRSLLTCQPNTDPQKNHVALKLYAPLSLIYLVFVMGSLFRFVIFWVLDNAFHVALLFFIAWAIYFFFPRSNSVH